MMDHAIFETLWNLPTLSCDLMSPSASPVVPHRQIGPCAPLLRFEVADGSAVRHNLHGEGWNNIDQHRKKYRTECVHVRPQHERMCLWE